METTIVCSGDWLEVSCECPLAAASASRASNAAMTGRDAEQKVDAEEGEERPQHQQQNDDVEKQHAEQGEQERHTSSIPQQEKLVILAPVEGDVRVLWGIDTGNEMFKLPLTIARLPSYGIDDTPVDAPLRAGDMVTVQQSGGPKFWALSRRRAESEDAVSEGRDSPNPRVLVWDQAMDDEPSAVSGTPVFFTIADVGGSGARGEDGEGKRYTHTRTQEVCVGDVFRLMPVDIGECAALVRLRGAGQGRWEMVVTEDNINGGASLTPQEGVMGGDSYTSSRLPHPPTPSSSDSSTAPAPPARPPQPSSSPPPQAIALHPDNLDTPPSIHTDARATPHTPAQETLPAAVFRIESVIHCVLETIDGEGGGDGGSRQLRDSLLSADTLEGIGEGRGEWEDVPRPPPCCGEEVCVFQEGELGITIKRTPSGQARVMKLISGTQAEINGVAVGDVIRQVDGLDLRNVVLDSKSWAGLVSHMKSSPRPLRVVVARGAVTPTPRDDVERAMAAIEAQLDLSTCKRAQKRGGEQLLVDGLCNGIRRLVKSGRLRLWVEGRLWRSWQPKDVLLFSDVLILCAPLPPPTNIRAEVDVVVGLATCKIRERGSDDVAHTFEILTPSGAVRLCAETDEDRRAWVEALYSAAVEALQVPDSMKGGLLRHQLVVDSLHAAVLQGKPQDVQAWIERHGSERINEVDEYGRTPLHYAPSSRQHDIMSLLLTSGADQTIYTANHDNQLPIHLSAVALDDAAIALLLSASQSKGVVGMRDGHGRTPAFLAAVLGRLPSGDRDIFAVRRCLNALLAYDADLDAVDDTGRTALHYAAAKHDAKIVEVLAELGSDVNQVSVDDFAGTPLHWSCWGHAASYAHQHTQGHTHTATHDGDDDTQLCADTQPHSTRTPHPVVECVDALAHTLDALLRHGADPNVRGGIEDLTPLHLLVENDSVLSSERLRAIGVLVSYGARADVPNADGKTVAQIVAAAARAEAGNGQGRGDMAAIETALASSRQSWAKKEQLRVPDAQAVRLLQRAKSRPGCILPPGSQRTTPKPDSTKSSCYFCGATFTLTSRQHRCRLCGHTVCSSCSSKRVQMGAGKEGGGVGLKIGGLGGDTWRACDGCYNWACREVEWRAEEEHRQRRREMESSLFISKKAFVAEDADAQYDRDQQELYGGASFGEKAMSWLMGGSGGGGGIGDTQTDTTATNLKKSARLENELAEVRKGLEQRGERLTNLADKTAELADASSHFAAMAKALNEQQSRGPFGLW